MQKYTFFIIGLVLFPRREKSANSEERTCYPITNKSNVQILGSATVADIRKAMSSMAQNKCIPLTLLAFFRQGSVKGITLKLYKQRFLCMAFIKNQGYHQQLFRPSQVLWLFDAMSSSAQPWRLLKQQTCYRKPSHELVHCHYPGHDRW